MPRTSTSVRMVDNARVQLRNLAATPPDPLESLYYGTVLANAREIGKMLERGDTYSEIVRTLFPRPPRPTVSWLRRLYMLALRHQR